MQLLLEFYEYLKKLLDSDLLSNFFWTFCLFLSLSILDLVYDKLTKFNINDFKNYARYFIYNFFRNTLLIILRIFVLLCFIVFTIDLLKENINNPKTYIYI